MSLQSRGFQWSIAIHGLFILSVVVVQVFAVPQNRIVVIDFTLAADRAPSRVERPSPPAPVARPEPKQARLVQPREVKREHAPIPAEEKAPAPSFVADSREEIPSSLPTATEESVTPAPAGSGGATDPSRTAGVAGGEPAKGVPRNTADAADAVSGAAAGSAAAGKVATPEQAKAAYLKEHFVYIRDRITGSISYPLMARKMGWFGQVKIAFIVCEDGSVSELRVLESSGFSLLDRNTIDTVKRVVPFPRPPVSAEIRMAIAYRLN
jgi:periplasmic protein TonB